MASNEAELEEIWAELFSGDAARVRKVWMTLTDEECGIVLQHLQHVLDDPGFEPSQKESAATALRLIQEIGQ